MMSNAIDLNPEVLLRELPETPVVAPFVQHHIGSLQELVGDMESAGSLLPTAASFGHLFAVRHDAGYGTDISMLRTDGANAVLNLVLDAVGSSVAPRQVTDYLLANQANHAAARTIGHGILGLVNNTQHFQEVHRLSADRALGIASLLTAHHPGFPITMVSGLLSGAARVPDAMRSALFIDDNGENPEVVRQRLVALGAARLGVSQSDASKAAVLGFALDRITAGKTPRSIRITEGGTVQVLGGEVIQKKYGLVTGDLRGDETIQNPSIELLYRTVIERLKEESAAAITAATFAGEPEIERFVTEQAGLTIAATEAIQQNALNALHTIGLSGDFSQMTTDRAVLLDHAQRIGSPHLAYALATYDAVIRASRPL